MLFWGVLIIEIVFLFYTSKHVYQSLFTLLNKLFKNRGLSEKLIFSIFLPGVIVHELSHMLFAEITFVKTFHLDISPKIEDGYLRLGSVEIQKTDIARRALIGLAPLLSGVIIISSIIIIFSNYFDIGDIFLSPEYFFLHIVVGWAIFVITNTMFSSEKDLEGFVVFGLTVAFFTLVGAVTLILLNQNPLAIFIDIVSSPISLELSRTAATSLIVPVIINGSIFLSSKVLAKHKG